MSDSTVRRRAATLGKRARPILSMLRATVLAAAVLCAAAVTALPGSAAAETAPKIRIAVLKFGTVNWLMDVITANGLDARHGFELSLVELAGRDGAAIALQSGDVDVVTNDWFWALRARAEGEKLVFSPYSSALGALVVAADSPIRTAADLKGRKIGIAGGATDKSWLLLRAYGEKEGAGDLASTAEPVFGAPPLLSEQLRLGGIDADLTYWHFAARLEGGGARQFIGVTEIMTALGIDPPPPLVGFVWSTETIAGREAAMEGFLAAVVDANALLASSDAEWDRIRPLMQIDSDAEFAALKARYRQGIVSGWTKADTAGAEALYRTVETIGGQELLGEKTRFDPAVFHIRGS